MNQNLANPALFPPPSGVGVITPTESEVLKRAFLPNKIIADDMYISPFTVNNHIQSILNKTGYSSKIELAVFATKEGYIN